MSTEYKCGTPSYDEWKGFWACDAASTEEVSDSEDHEVYNALRAFLQKHGKVGIGGKADYYIDDSPLSDRTLYLIVENAEFINLNFFLELQRWLCKPMYSKWRIYVPTYLKYDRQIMIYPSVIRISADLDAKLPAAIDDIRERFRIELERQG